MGDGQRNRRPMDLNLLVNLASLIVNIIILVIMIRRQK